MHALHDLRLCSSHWTITDSLVTLGSQFINNHATFRVQDYGPVTADTKYTIIMDPLSCSTLQTGRVYCPGPNDATNIVILVAKGLR